MPGRTLDAVIMEILGIKEITIARLLWQVEDQKAQIADLTAKLQLPVTDRPKDSL